MQSAKKRMRTCIGCGQQFPKEQLKRVVRSSDGTVAFDETGRAPGRGAYVCSATCLDQAIKGKKLQRSFKAAIERDDVETITGQLLESFGDDVR